MIRLEKLDAWQRKIRQDDCADLGILTPVLAREAIQAGRIDDAIEFVEYADFEARQISQGMVGMAAAVVNYIANTFGEEELEKMWRQRYLPWTKDWCHQQPSVEQTLQYIVELQRALHGNLTIVEEPDRYVFTADPCGSGGRMERTNRNVTKKAYPWSWGKKGILYYCTHCCVFWMILFTEVRGYPQQIVLSPEKLGDPCIHLLYKKPQLIPEEYFTMIGKTKTIK